jgi:TonB family protein
VSKPIGKTDKAKADTAFEKPSKEADSNVQKTAIQRQLERELAVTESVVEVNSATAVQDPIPPAVNTLLRKARFAAITLFFSGLTFWLGLQISSQPTPEAAPVSSPEPAVAASAVAKAATEPEAVNLDQQILSEGDVAISQPVGEEATDQKPATVASEEASTSIEDDIPVAAIDSSKTESATDDARSTSVIAAGVGLTAKNSPVDAARTQQPSIETTQATTTADVTNPEPDEKASTAIDDSPDDTAAAVVAATVVAVTQSKPPTQTAALTAKNSPVAATATQQPPIETTQATTTGVTNPEPEAKASTTVEDGSGDTASAAAAATAVVAATVVAATQSTRPTQTADLANTSMEKASQTKATEASKTLPPTSPTMDSAEAVPPADQAIALEDKVQAPEQITVTEEIGDDKFAQFSAEYGKQSNLLIQRQVIYPKRAIARKQEGKVSVEVIIDRNGKVLDMIVVEDPGHKLLVKAAIRAIKKVKNLPTLPADFPNDNFSLTIPIVFKMP